MSNFLSSFVLSMGKKSSDTAKASSDEKQKTKSRVVFFPFSAARSPGAYTARSVWFALVNDCKLTVKTLIYHQSRARDEKAAAREC